MTELKKVTLVLENDIEFIGKSFGYERSVTGELVFNTAMTGYPESLTDSSYRGQILISTYPLIGNYGVPEYKKFQNIPQYFESDRIHISGLVISDYSFQFSHWNAKKSLADWLKEHEIPGIFGIDTRAVTKILRENGSMLGKLVFNEEPVEFYDPNRNNLVNEVSIKQKKVYSNGAYRVLLVDCGVKNNIIRCFLKRDITVVRVPWDYDFSYANYDGIFISNGPGDPKMCEATIKNIRKVLSTDKPIFGICLGAQLMALAAGANTYKLKYGHRSHNQPVLRKGTKRCYITSQNHGFAIDTKTLPPSWEVLFTNINDDTCEGIRHKSKPFFSSQFHPEASGGPVDTESLFDDFLSLIKNKR